MKPVGRYIKLTDALKARDELLEKRGDPIPDGPRMLTDAMLQAQIKELELRQKKEHHVKQLLRDDSDSDFQLSESDAPPKKPKKKPPTSDDA